jgi:plasmid stabilization system protein ParE
MCTNRHITGRLSSPVAPAICQAGLRRLATGRRAVRSLDRYLTSLESCCQQLAHDPGLRRSYDDEPSYWRALAGKHAIFYRVEADGSLLIVRILHTAMLPELHLPGATDEDGDQDERA